jgi:hypothetical protein
MPRNVRNFWVDGVCDGRSPVAFGPRNKDGGIRVVVHIRENGDVKCAGRLVGRALSDGTLKLEWEWDDGRALELVSVAR